MLQGLITDLQIPPAIHYRENMRQKKKDLKRQA
jgi:hypothetical protein